MCHALPREFFMSKWMLVCSLFRCSVCLSHDALRISMISSCMSGMHTQLPDFACIGVRGSVRSAVFCFLRAFGKLVGIASSSIAPSISFCILRTCLYLIGVRQHLWVWEYRIHFVLYKVVLVVLRVLQYPRPKYLGV